MTKLLGTKEKTNGLREELIKAYKSMGKKELNILNDWEITAWD